MNTPKRIQRKRTKGWRMPEGAVYVGRPTTWGNPFSVERVKPWPRWAGAAPWVVIDPAGNVLHPEGNRRSIVGRQEADEHRHAQAAQLAVDLYRECFESGTWSARLAADDLAGHDLACWCPLDQPCHADVLLELANAGKSA